MHSVSHTEQYLIKICLISVEPISEKKDVRQTHCIEWVSDWTKYCQWEELNKSFAQKHKLFQYADQLNDRKNNN